MDVRCERCATEYELDDDSVPTGGCPVQCTSCGHTFTVHKPAPPPNGPSPPPADWLLETSDGLLHRFRNLTSLQKWIIERKVTREDKISRTGQSWRKLGEIVELSPFFDVVDEADRARAVQAGLQSDDLKAEALRARQIGSARSYPTGTPPRPVASAPSSPLPGRPRDSDDIAGLDAWAADGQAIADAQRDVDEDTSVTSRGRGGKVLAGVVVAGLLVIGGIFVATRQRSSSREPASTPNAPAVALAPNLPSPSPAAPNPAVPVPVAAAPEPAAPEPAANPVVAPSGDEVPVGGSTALSTAPVEKPAQDVVEAPVKYEKIVMDADRLLENGGTEKAIKLYERALKLQPEGVDALTGMAYAMLDKERVRLAASYFERALSQAPSYGPAMFGLAEAMREEGNEARALEIYRHYLQINSGGADAPAARRQLRLLEEKRAKAGSGSEAQAPSAPDSPKPSALPAPTESSAP